MDFTTVNECPFTLHALLKCNPQVLKRLATNLVLGSKTRLTAGLQEKIKFKRKKTLQRKYCDGENSCPWKPWKQYKRLSVRCHQVSSEAWIWEIPEIPEISPFRKVLSFPTRKKKNLPNKTSPKIPPKKPKAKKQKQRNWAEKQENQLSGCTVPLQATWTCCSEGRLDSFPPANQPNFTPIF